MNTSCLRFGIGLTLGMLVLVSSATARADEPVIVYEKVFGQFGYVQPHDIVVDDGGNAYVLGARPGSNYATLVLKLDPDGDPIWWQWFDGNSHDIPGGIAIGGGNVYVVGTTGSDDFPLLNPFQAAPTSVQYEAFILKLSAADGTLLYSTYFGAMYSEWGEDIAVNAEGEMYIVGMTESPYLPMVNPLQEHLGGDPYYPYEDAYVAKFSADGSELLYSTYFGGGHVEWGRGIALDDAGRIYIVGETRSDDLPTVNPAQGTKGGAGDAFAARISADGSTLEYSTYLGGEEGEAVRSIALDGAGRLYFGGHTGSIYLPTTPGAYQEDFVGGILACEVPFSGHYNCDDVYLARLSADGAAYEYTTYLGGYQIDQCYSIAVDAAGNTYATGHTKSDDFPPYDSGTFYTNYVTKLDGTASNLIYSFLHDTVTPSPAYLALDSVGDIYVAATVGTPTELTVIKLSGGGTQEPGDMDGNGSVDLNDFATFALCFSGADVSVPPLGCAAADFAAADMDGDGDADLSDFATFATCFEG